LKIFSIIVSGEQWRRQTNLKSSRWLIIYRQVTSLTLLEFSKVTRQGTYNSSYTLVADNT
jgi:hypothetical protein